MTSAITESEVEEVALEILSNLGYSTLHDPDITPDGTSPERNAVDARNNSPAPTDTLMYRATL